MAGESHAGIPVWSQDFRIVLVKSKLFEHLQILLKFMKTAGPIDLKCACSIHTCWGDSAPAAQPVFRATKALDAVRRSDGSVMDGGCEA